MNPAIRCWAFEAQLGEGPVWVQSQQKLYFVDIKAPAVHALNPTTGERWRWSMPKAIGWLLPEDEAGLSFIAGLRDGFVRLRLEPDVHVEYLVRPHPDQPELRLNDAKRDGHGRIWAGSMHDLDQSRPDGRLYCLNPDGSWFIADSGYHICNGPTFSNDGRTLFHADSWLGRIYAYDVDSQGALGQRRVWRQFLDGEGFPDGMCTDSEGCLWVAHWGGARVSRFSPDGRLLRSIGLPVSQVTSCTLASDDRLFVTSARVGLSAESVAAEPLAGAVFELRL